jgi:hypothetical protein
MTPLTALPERFTVGMCLDVSDTHIQEFPRNLKVGWKIQVGKNATQSMKARAAALDRKTCQPAKASSRKATTPEPEVLKIIGAEAKQNRTHALTSRQIDEVVKLARADKKKR